MLTYYYQTALFICTIMSDLGQRRWSGSLTIQFIIYAMTDNEEKMAMYLYMADTQPRSIGKWKSH